MTDRRRRGDDPITIGESIAAVAGRLGRSELVGLAAISEHFEELVGAPVAAHARPLRLAGETLTIAVDQPAWATQLRLLSGRLLAPLSEIARSPITAIEVVVRTT